MSIALILPGIAPSGALELFFHSLTAWPPAQPCTLYLVGFDALPPAAPADSVLVPAAGGYSACLAAGLTTALAKAEHTHFCLLHADTVLSPGWLDDLLAADADAVGPVTNFARTSQQLAGAPALRQNRFSVGKAADWAKNRRADFGAQPPVKAEQLSAFCLLLTRSAAQAVAGLPADLPDPALAEQGISLLLRQKGFSMVCCRAGISITGAARAAGGFPPTSWPSGSTPPAAGCRPWVAGSLPPGNWPPASPRIWNGSPHTRSFCRCGSPGWPRVCLLSRPDSGSWPSRRRTPAARWLTASTPRCPRGFWPGS